MPTITGYVTETHGESGFKIMITEDNFDGTKGKRLKLPEEAEVTISGHLYPHDSAARFVEAGESRKNRIKRCKSISKGLKKGDMVTCLVYSVEVDNDINETIYKIKDNDTIQSYEDSNLWLYQSEHSFFRLDVDTPQSVKFRKQNSYLDRNRKKCEEIVGDLSYKYNKKRWMYKHPKRNVLRFVGLRIKTKVSNLWGYLSAKNMTVLGIMLSVPLAIIGIVVTIIVAIIYR